MLSTGWFKAGLLLVVFAAGGWVGSDYSDRAWSLKWSERDESDREAKELFDKTTKALERKLSTALSDADVRYQQGIDDGKKSLEADIAELRDGTRRLRDRFTCPPGVPSAAPSASGGDAAQAAGLQPEDAEFLIRLAADADDTARRLTACQQILIAERHQ